MPTPTGNGNNNTRSPARSPARSAPKSRATRRTRKQIMLDTVDDLRKMINESCEVPEGAKPKTQTRKANMMTLATPAALAESGPATMVPLTLGNAFAKTAAPAKAVAKASKVVSAVVSAVPVSKRAAPKPSLRANQDGSWNKFLKNWMASHPGMKRPDAMKAAGDNWKAFKAGRTPAAAAAVAAAAAAAAPNLSRVAEEADEEAEENLGLL